MAKETGRIFRPKTELKESRKSKPFLLSGKQSFPKSAFIVLILMIAFIWLESCQYGGQAGYLATGLTGIPTLGDLLKKKPALTTSLQDAVTEVPFLDDYNPAKFSRLRRIPIQGPDIRYHCIPGHWEINLKSYCLHAGAYGPGKGDGYLYAPLKGPRADIIRAILRNSIRHPKIPQPAIQTLIWAVLSRTKISRMSIVQQGIAALLLTPKQILELNGGALGLIPKSAYNKLFSNLPQGVRSAMEAGATLRGMLSSGIDAYEQLERVAVLTGIAPHQEGDREVPAYRWSYHPNGYFVRYKPFGYPRTLVEISVPSFCTIKWDKLGRITSVTDNRGNTLEAEYDDTIKPLRFSEKSTPAGYTFRLIRFTHKNPKNPDENYSNKWTGQGWTFVGVPQERSRKIGNAPELYSGVDQRIKWAANHKTKVDSICSQAPPSLFRDTLTEKASEIGVFTHAVKQFVEGKSNDGEKSAKAASFLLKETWQQMICLATMKKPSRRSSGYAHAHPHFFGPPLGNLPRNGEIGFNPGYYMGNVGNNDSEGFEIGFDLSGDSSVPGSQGEQRLGMGGPESEQIDVPIDKYSDGYDEGYRMAGGYGTRDGVEGNPYDPGLPMKPLVPKDPGWLDGFKDGYYNGYRDGYNVGKGYKN